MKAKPRGSTKGLKTRTDIIKQANTERLLAALRTLEAEKPHDIWTLLEVSRIAGLKSTMAINSIWNAHVKLNILHHNENVSTHSIGGDSKTSSSDILNARTTQNLRAELLVCQKQRNEAMSKIALYAADAEYHKKKSIDLARIVERLRESKSVPDINFL